MISRRGLEISTAMLTGGFGLAVAISSIDNGIGWSAAGVEAGTFPFLAGLIICFGSLFNLVRGALAGGTPAISSLNLQHLARLFVPAAIFIGVIPLVGIYLGAAGYMFGILSWPRNQPLFRAITVALVTPLALYLVFERMFQVTLPHGLLPEALGF
jgi:hypothetical protein